MSLSHVDTHVHPLWTAQRATGLLRRAILALDSDTVPVDQFGTADRIELVRLDASLGASAAGSGNSTSPTSSATATIERMQTRHGTLPVMKGGENRHDHHHGRARTVIPAECRRSSLPTHHDFADPVGRHQSEKRRARVAEPACQPTEYQ